MIYIFIALGIVWITLHVYYRYQLIFDPSAKPQAGSLNSCFYEGVVRHRRFLPKGHEFSYGIFNVLVDLDELENGKLDSMLKRWKPIISFRREDHLGKKNESLKKSIQDYIEERTNKRPKGSIWLLSSLRYFGHTFNPVSFFYCLDEKNENVEFVILEVHNTPWSEKHCYLVSPSTTTGVDNADLTETVLAKLAKGDSESTKEEAKKKSLCFRFNKDFHVSPFMEMDYQYEWRFNKPSGFLFAHCNNLKLGTDKKWFDADYIAMRRELSLLNLFRLMFVSYPLVTMKIVLGIYWEALKLYTKIPFVMHPHTQPKTHQPQF